MWVVASVWNLWPQAGVSGKWLISDCNKSYFAVMLIATAKSWNARGTYHQPNFMGSCLTISHTCLPCPLSWQVSPCVLWPLMILLTFFGMVSMAFFLWRVDAISTEWIWNLRTKLYFIASGKWNVSRVSLQGFGIRYIMF